MFFVVWVNNIVIYLTQKNMRFFSEKNVAKFSIKNAYFFTKLFLTFFLCMVGVRILCYNKFSVSAKERA